MLRTLLISSLCCCTLLAGQSRADDPDSLRASVSTSLSLTTPTTKERVVAVGDTVKNSFDYLFGIGLSGSYGKFTFSMDYGYKRVSGLNYVDLEYKGKYVTSAYEVGYRLIDLEYGGDQYLLSVYAEGKLFGWVGVGVTREHYEPWLGSGETLARFSLARNQFNVFGLQTNISLEYELKPTAHRVYFKGAIRNFKFGRLSITPQYTYERIKAPNADATTAFSGRIIVSMDI